MRASFDLRPRASETSQSYPTNADGCLDCPNTIDPCPTCEKGMVCHQISRTCNQCPKNICVKNTSPTTPSGKIGGIVGGVVGGVVVILIILAIYLYYKCVYVKKRQEYEDEMPMDEYKIDPDESDVSPSQRETLSSGEAERPQARRTDLSNSVLRNKRLSTYDSFMRPQARYARPTARGGVRGGRGGRGMRGRMRAGSHTNLSKRNSIATTISTTNASNILPVAYIPGVTVRPTKNNTKSIYSYETDLIFSDIHGIDNASIVAAERQNQQNNKGTMTAIRAQPKLINIARIEEGDEDEPQEEGDSSFRNDMTWDIQSSGTRVPPSQIGEELEGEGRLSPFEDANEIAEENENPSEPDLDVDSDIGEINQAKGGKIPQAQNSETPHEILIDLENAPPEDLTEGLFILDIGKGK